MRILMLGWEFPPFVAGGLGTACQGLTKALARQGHAGGAAQDRQNRAFRHQVEMHQPGEVVHRKGAEGQGHVVRGGDVQLFAANQDAPGRNVGRRVRAFVVAIAPVVADAVDHTRREERNPDHLHRPDGQTEHAEERDVQDEKERNTADRKA